MPDKYCVMKADNNGCYLCRRNSRELFLMRHVDSGKLTALCSPCAMGNLDSYLIDNTRPWPCLGKDPEPDRSAEV